MLSVLLSVAVWAIIGLNEDAIPRWEEALEVMHRSTFSVIRNSLDMPWILDQLGDDFRYLTFGATNLVVAVASGLLGGLLSDGPRR